MRAPTELADSPASSPTVLTEATVSSAAAWRAAGGGRAGTQLLARGARVLRLLATRGEIGWRLSDLCVACGLDKGTTHRILACLVREGMAQQRCGDRRYLPGPLLYELGLSLPGHHVFQQRAQRRLEALAPRLGGIACLLLRSGYEYVCSVRAGTIQLTGLLVYPGTRRPLFTSVGGVAILQTLDPAEATDILHNNIGQEVVKRGTARLAALKQMRDDSARHGFGVNLGVVVPGLHAFALPVHGANGHAIAAVCLMGTADVLHEGRLGEIRGELAASARELEADARGSLWPAPAGA